MITKTQLANVPFTNYKEVCDSADKVLHGKTLCCNVLHIKAEKSLTVVSVHSSSVKTK